MGGTFHLHLQQLCGTSNENLLRFVSGNPTGLIRAHRCSPECTGAWVADDLSHIVKARLMKPKDQEEGWVENFVSVPPAEDDLTNLRARGEGLTVGGAAEAVEGRERGRSSKGKKDKKKSRPKKDKKRKKEGRNSPDRGVKPKKEEKAKKEARSCSCSQVFTEQCRLEWAKAQDSGNEGAISSFCRDRTGAEREGAQEGCKEGASQRTTSPDPPRKTQRALRVRATQEQLLTTQRALNLDSKVKGRPGA